MSTTTNGATLFKLVMHPRATAEEVVALDLEILTQKVAYRRRRKVPKGALDPTWTDEQIARAILDYARSEAGAKSAAPGFASPTGPERDLDGESLVCPDCGGANPPDCLFCLRCGALLA